MNDSELLTACTVLKIGRKRTLHRVHIGIEDMRVVIRARCGIDPTEDGFTETYGIPTCDECEAAS